MTAAAIEISELRRWLLSAIVVLGVHAAATMMLLTWHDPITFGEPSDAVVVDLEPLSAAPSDTAEDLPAGPKQQEAEAAPAPGPDEVERKQEERIELPPAPVPPVAALRTPEPITPNPPVPMREPPAPAATAPPRARASRAQINAWYSSIATQLERHKAYPRAARERGETGITRLAFSIDRQGHVLASAIIKSSGHPALDQETIATVRRAQPFPAPPAGLAGAKFDFTVPIKFNIR